MTQEKLAYIRAVDEIKRRISCREFAERVGIEITRSGFCCCPFHGEKTPSLKVYPGERGWYCFGCHQGGDVIDLAKKWLNLPFKETIMEMNRMFNLGMNFGAKISSEDQMKASVERAKRKAEINKRKRLKEQAEIEFWHLFDKYRELEKIIEEYRPKSTEDEISQKWANAVIEKEYVTYLLEEAEAKRRSYEK